MEMLDRAAVATIVLVGIFGVVGALIGLLMILRWIEDQPHARLEAWGTWLLFGLVWLAVFLSADGISGVRR